MGTHQVHRVLLVSWSPLIFILRLSWLQFSSSAYTVLDNYYINCGSESSVRKNLTGLVFVDEPSSSFSFTKLTSAEKEDDIQSSAGQNCRSPGSPVLPGFPDANLVRAKELCGFLHTSRSEERRFSVKFVRSINSTSD